MLLDLPAHVGIASGSVWRFSDVVAPMEKPKSAEVRAFWEEFRQARGVPQQPFDACRFAEDALLNDELLVLVLRGIKRATACLVRDVEAGYDMMARVGGHVVLLDGRDRPRAIWRTRTVDVKPLDQVDDAFAWDEGEGERTRDDWLAAHVRFYSGRAAREGFAFDASMPAVFERFTIVWPPQHADPE
jgi:uncharacterized protein YhfF